MPTGLTPLASECGAPRPWSNFEEFHQWSITHPVAFWDAMAKRLVWQKSPSCSTDTPQFMEAQWFAGGELNYAENLLRGISERQTAIVSIDERGERRFSGKELRAFVASAQDEMRKLGIQKGDRVCGIVTNEIEAVVAMLAATSLGAIWSSCSPDFGVQAVLDRFAQIEPVLLVYSPHYQYAGKTFDTDSKVHEIQRGLPSLKAAWSTLPLKGAIHWMRSDASNELIFVPCAAMDPLFIMYSSGTTGKPKCMVHSVAGTLVQHVKEHQLHCDLKPGDRLFFYTTCGWMMWNWMVSALASGVELVLYDGAVHTPDLHRLWKIVEEHGVHTFGTSPKFVSLCLKEGLKPEANASLRQILSTGAPLLHEHFDALREWFPSVKIASISGGTDIISCFLLGHPWGSCERGELQGPGLGMDVQVWNDEGQRVYDQPGELVCCTPFPSSPVSFWKDEGHQLYRKAYFGKYPGVWCHGDSVMQSSVTGGFIVYGRSDATLNPNGIRIGTSEIYRCVEMVPEILDSIVAAFKHQGEDFVVLFLKAASENKEIVQKLRSVIKSTLSPRHLPWRIEFVRDIPYTKSGKKVELAVAAILNQQPVKSEVINGEVLDQYRSIAQTIRTEMNAKAP